MANFTDKPGQDLQAQLGALYRNEAGRRVLATLIRLLGDFDRAEEALHDAFKAALEQWPKEGMPANPRAWLISAGRFKAIDKLRRDSRFDTLDEINETNEALITQFEDEGDEYFEDDRLRLIFTCCHPSLPPDAQIALTLREICGLTTEKIARAFLISPTSVAQRIVRAKAKIRAARIPYEVPEPQQLPERLDSVLKVVYLVFNEGYLTTSGPELIRHDLSAEALRLGRLLLELLPGEPEIMGLLALMLLQDSRRDARISAHGDLILLEEQDRALWDKEKIGEGTKLVNAALTLPSVGVYTLQAVIAANHALAASSEATDWLEIIRLYDLLLRIFPSPVIELNRAAAIAMRDGPQAGLKLIDRLLGQGQLRDYHYLYAAKADFHRRLGETHEAIAAYRQAQRLVRQETERRFLERRLAELKK